MGNKCGVLHGSPDPDALHPIKNICTMRNAEGTGIASGDEASVLQTFFTSVDITSGNDNVDAEKFVTFDFCAEPTNNAYMSNLRDYCHKVGGDPDNPEWSLAGSKGLIGKSLSYDTDHCSYADGDTPNMAVVHSFKNPVGGGCCGVTCIFHLGRYGMCQREIYTGDPLKCCFKDFECDNSLSNINNINDCYSDNNQRYTCDFKYRNMANTECQDQIFDYCVGNKMFPAETNWMELWLPTSIVNIADDPDTDKVMIKAPCLMAVLRNIFNEATEGVCTYEALSSKKIEGFNTGDGYIWAKLLITEVFNKYIEEFGTPLNGVNADGYIKSVNFFNFMFDFCSQYPVLCDEFLKDLCVNTTEEDIKTNPTLGNWCGCYMPEDQYKTYSDKYNLGRECSPFCNQKDTIKLVEEDGSAKVCLENACIINDLVIEAYQSKFPNGFNFNQLCNSCGGDNQIARKFEEKTSDIKSNTEAGYNFSYGPNLFYQYNLPAGLDENGDPKALKDYFLTRSTGGKIPNNEGVIVDIIDQTSAGNFVGIPIIAPGSETEVLGNNITIMDFGSKPPPTFKFQIKCEADSDNYQHDGPPRNTTGDNTWRCYVTGIDKTINGFGAFDSEIGGLVNIVGINRFGKEGNLLEPNGSGNEASPNFFSNVSTTGSKNKYAYSYLYDLDSVSAGKQEVKSDVLESQISAIASDCSCILDNSTVQIIDSKVDNLNLNQNCGSTLCHDANGNNIPCNNSVNNITQDSYSSDSTFLSDYKNNKKTEVDLTMVIFLVALFSIIVLFRIFHSHYKSLKRSK